MIEPYKRDLDLTLLRENLKRTPTAPQLVREPLKLLQREQTPCSWARRRPGST